MVVCFVKHEWHYLELFPFSHPLIGTMIGGVFIYNHKGEVLISRVFRDAIT